VRGENTDLGRSSGLYQLVTVAPDDRPNIGHEFFGDRVPI